MDFAEDKGHRLGNFHNYYAFNHPTNRLHVLNESGMLNYLQADFHSGTKNNVHVGSDEPQEKRRKKDSNAWSYCDLGCNEGDLSLAIADAITQVNSVSHGKEANATSMVCLGLDIDPILIGRAKLKTVPTSIKAASFRTCNIGIGKAHLSTVQSFFDEVSKDVQTATPVRWNLTSIFSTTMWIHIHYGDSGLTQFLQRVCQQTELLLVEPQPSKW